MAKLVEFNNSSYITKAIELYAVSYGESASPLSVSFDYLSAKDKGCIEHIKKYNAFESFVTLVNFVDDNEFQALKTIELIRLYLPTGDIMSEDFIRKEFSNFPFEKKEMMLDNIIKEFKVQERLSRAEPGRPETTASIESSSTR